MCQTCGTINSVDGSGAYNFNNNVYGLNSCDHNFFIDFDNTTYELYDEHQHTTVLKKGEYCQFCKGTYAKANIKKESHDLSSTVDGQIGNNRFYLTEKCDDCGYTTSEYVAAKSVVSSYYGTADGDAHTVSVSDLSDSGVHTKIRYGKTASDCYMTSAPNYTKAGYYPVYYEISYKYGGETMVENGVSYVWLLEDKKDDNNGGTVIVLPEKHEHDYRYLETVAPSCDNLGYERWQCDGCGNLDKRNYTKATGHNYKAIIIREATCKQGGLKLSLCDKCGSFYEESTPIGEHKYKTEKVQPTCRNVGYANHICEICGNSYITDMTPIILHAYERITKEPTCTDKGYTTSTCTMCGQTFVSDYTEPTGHNWDGGHSVTSSTCTADGVIEYHCTNAGCKEKMIKAESATGHTPGEAATCTEPQTCEKCGTVLALPTGHNYSEKIVAPNCTEMGYTIFECKDCKDTYNGDYTDKIAHDYKKTVTAPSCTAMGHTTYTCKNCDYKYISDYTDKINHSYIADVTEPTCTASGYTVYTCEKCGKTYTADYKDMTGHNPSDWIIDKPATIEHAGEKHIECLTCGEVLSRASIPQLVEKDRTDEDGNSKVGDFSILVTNKDGKPIFDSEISIDINDNVTIKLPSGRLLDYAGQTIITAMNTDSQQPKSELQIFVYDDNNNAATGKTDENGKATVPPTNIDVTDFNGYGEVDGYIVIVKNAVGAIEKAHIKHNAEIKNEDDSVKSAENISVELPEGVKFDYANRITVSVSRKADNTAVKGMTVVTSEFVIEGTETKSLTGITDKDGIIILPPASEGITDKDGKTDISETIPGKDTDGDGKEDTEESKTEYNITVEDTKGKIENAYIEIKDSKITVTLPDTHTLTTSNQTTVTVLDKENKGVANVSVTVTDKNKATATKSTDTNGKVTLPVKSSGGGSSSGGGGGRGSSGGSYISSNITNITVTDKNGKNVSVSKSTDKDGKITLTLPNGANLTGDNYYTIKATDNKGNAKAEISIVLKDKKNNTANGTTDKNGMLILPASEHKAYIFGYNDGTFRPDNNMSRAEAAAIFARLISEQKGEKISGKSNFNDVSKNEWYSDYIGYLSKYGIIKGYSDNTFRPNDNVSRAEFVAMTVRFNSLFNDVKKGSYTVKYTDVASNYWAYSDVAYAKHAGWLNGYADGTFKGDNAITRAEVVTVVNRATGRKADESYITKNVSVLNKFTDIRNNSMWYYTDVMEAANTHLANSANNTETWVK